jgi:CRISPR-associated endoribonuclease Cas6
MRIRVLLVPENPTPSLPLDNYPLASLIYRSVSIVAPDHAEFLHSQGYLAPRSDNLLTPEPRSGGKRFKFFVFSRPYVLNARVQDGRLRFDPGPVEWQISSPIQDFIEDLVNGLSSQGSITIGDQHADTRFRIDRIEIVPPPRFTTRMRFTTLSPLTVAIAEEDARGLRSKHYVRAEDERFGPLVASNMLEKYRALTGYDTSELKLKFEFDWEYINRSGGPGRVSKLLQCKGTNIKCYPVPFFASGSAELIRLGWECGFGAANSKGFGMAQAAGRYTQI